MEIFPGGKNTTALTSPPKERIRKGQRNSQESPLPLVMPFFDNFLKMSYNVIHLERSGYYGYLNKIKRAR